MLIKCLSALSSRFELLVVYDRLVVRSMKTACYKVINFIPLTLDRVV